MFLVGKVEDISLLSILWVYFVKVANVMLLPVPAETTRAVRYVAIASCRG